MTPEQPPRRPIRRRRSADGVEWINPADRPLKPLRAITDDDAAAADAHAAVATLADTIDDVTSALSEVHNTANTLDITAQSLRPLPPHVIRCAFDADTPDARRYWTSLTRAAELVDELAHALTPPPDAGLELLPCDCPDCR